MAILFAFCCLAFAAVNDFVFKLFARKERSRGIFVALIGMVWLMLLCWMPWNKESSVAATILWGAVSGFFSVTANLLLIEAMGHESAGVCSTTYRLNLVLVVAGAVLFLGETLTVIQAVGILFAILAILAFFPMGQNIHLRTVGFYLVVIAAILRAGMGLTYRYGFLHGADRNGVVVINSVFWIIGGIVYALRREKRIGMPNRKMLVYSGLSGLFVAGIVVFMALSLQYGEASVVLPIAQMSFLGTFGLSICFLKERFTGRNLIAVICGVIAVIFLTV